MPNNISNIPETREQTKSGKLLIFFIFLPQKIPKFKKALDGMAEYSPPDR